MYNYRKLKLFQVQDLGGRPVHFPGFSLAIFDLPDGRSADEEVLRHVHLQISDIKLHGVTYANIPVQIGYTCM